MEETPLGRHLFCSQSHRLPHSSYCQCRQRRWRQHRFGGLWRRFWRHRQCEWFFGMQTYSRKERMGCWLYSGCEFRGQVGWLWRRCCNVRYFLLVVESIFNMVLISWGRMIAVTCLFQIWNFARRDYFQNWPITKNPFFVLFCNVYLLIKFFSEQQLNHTLFRTYLWRIQQRLKKYDLLAILDINPTHPSNSSN